MNPKEAKKLCLDLLKITKGSEVKEILKKNNLWDKKEIWREYGDDSQSWSIVGGQGDAEFSLNEKIVNVEKELENLNKQLYESGVKFKQSEELKNKIKTLDACPVCIQPVSSSHKEHIDNIESEKMKRQKEF